MKKQAYPDPAAQDVVPPSKTTAKASLPRRILGDLLLVLSLLFTCCLVIVMRQRIQTVALKEVYQTVFHYELLLCAILVLSALDIRFGFLTRLRGLPLKILGWLLRLVLYALSLAILLLCFRVVAEGRKGSDVKTDYTIVLGMALQDGKPTKDLELRVKTAGEVAKKNPDTTLIVTGGNPDSSGKTEAAVMKELLLSLGVSEESILTEDKASSTRENFRNVGEMIGYSQPVLLITSSYHMARALRLAKEAGFTEVYPMPASSELFAYPANLLWELVQNLNSLKRP
ncbi:MAG: YdcF family protein [Blautia sp.]|nr:YdcF family protein [Blautia sp.]